MTKDMNVFREAPLSERMEYAKTMTNAGDLIPKGLWSVYQRPDGTMAPPAPSPGKVLLVMETGAMLGLHPVAALQGIHVIEGKATLSPALMSAVVRKAGHTLRVKTMGSIKRKDFSATATLIRSDDPDFEYSATWTMERAETAGLEGKEVWRKYGEAMCKARAISEVCREGAEDALMGIHYTPEELDAVVDESGTADVIEAEVEPAEDWEAALRSAGSKEAVAEVQERAQRAGQYGDAVRTAVLRRFGEINRGEISESVITRDWVAEAKEAQSLEKLTELFAEAQVSGEVALTLPDGLTVHDMFHRRRAELEKPAQEPLVDVLPARSGPRKWAREARLLTTRAEVQALHREAMAAGALVQVLEEIEAIERTLPDVEPERPAEEWAKPVGQGGWVEQPDGSFAEADTAGVLDESIGAGQ